MGARSYSLGLGIGWRPELALPIDRYEGLGFVEVIAEGFDTPGPIPEPLERLRARGVLIVPHGISLSLGGAEPPDRARLAALGRLATRLEAPLVSEHVAFVRAGGFEAGHLLPLPRTPLVSTQLPVFCNLFCCKRLGSFQWRRLPCQFQRHHG